MKLLCIASMSPEPADDGRKVRISWLLAALRNCPSVDSLTFACAAPAGTDPPQDPRSGSSHCFEVSRSQGSTGPSATLVRWGRAVVSGTPPWAVDVYSKSLHDFVLRRSTDYDIIFCLDDVAAMYLRGIDAGCSTVIDKHAVLSWLIEERPTTGRPEVLFRLRHKLLHQLVHRFERRAVMSADAIVLTGREDAVRLRSLGTRRRPDALVPTCPPLALAAAPSFTSKRIGFIGSLRMTPNLDGLSFYVNDQVDRLRHSGYTLHVAGPLPHSEKNAQELQRRGVVLDGFVENLEEWMNGLAAIVVPLWTGSGIKTKTVTSMGAGVPTVSTSVGLEGIPAEHAVHCLEGETPEELTDALLRLVSDRVLFDRIAIDGQRLIQSQFSLEASSVSLESMFKGLSFDC